MGDEAALDRIGSATLRLCLLLTMGTDGFLPPRLSPSSKGSAIEGVARMDSRKTLSFAIGKDLTLEAPSSELRGCAVGEEAALERTGSATLRFCLLLSMGTDGFLPPGLPLSSEGSADQGAARMDSRKDFSFAEGGDLKFEMRSSEARGCAVDEEAAVDLVRRDDSAGA